MAAAFQLIRAVNPEQEVPEKGDDIPEEYVEKNGIPEALDATDLWRDSLVLDYSLLSSSTPAAQAELLKLRSALSDWGCFQVINHGIDNSFLKELFEVSKQFFALPLEEKLKYAPADGILQGYENSRDGIESWNNRVTITIYPEEERKLQFWPQKPERFRGIVDEYSKILATLGEGIYKAMARSLNLKQDCFLNHIATQGAIAGRFCYYPRCPSPENVLGAKPHIDGSTMTTLLVDNEVEGLQVQKDDQWYKVPGTPGALFINLGDIGEVMTNGVFKGALHRVVTSSSKDRFSLVGFFNPGHICDIKPVSELVSLHHPQKYKKFNIEHYWKEYFEQYVNGQERKAVDAFKI